MTNYVNPAYFQDGYLLSNTPVVFDPTGVSTANAFTNEIHIPITEPDVWFDNGAFYTAGLVVTGIKSSDGSTVTLVPYTDYIYSPEFIFAAMQTGMEAYSYILLTNYSKWTSISVSYQAVGLTDAVLLQQIVQLGNFDRTLISNWTSLQGDAQVIGANDIADGLKNGNIAFMLSAQLQAIASSLSTPSSYLDFINGEFADMLATVGSLSAQINAWKAIFANNGVLSGPVVTAQFVQNQIAAGINNLVSVVTTTWVQSQISSANSTLQTVIDNQLTTAIAGLQSVMLSQSQLSTALSPYVKTTDLASALTGYATVSQLASVIPTGVILPLIGNTVPSGFLLLPQAQTDVLISQYPNLYAKFGTLFNSTSTPGTSFGLPYAPNGFSLVEGALGMYTVPAIYYSSTGVTQPSGTYNLGAGLNVHFIIKT